jgi:hypothetical protein
MILNWTRYLIYWILDIRLFSTCVIPPSFALFHCPLHLFWKSIQSNVTIIRKRPLMRFFFLSAFILKFSSNLTSSRYLTPTKTEYDYVIIRTFSLHLLPSFIFSFSLLFINYTDLSLNHVICNYCRNYAITYTRNTIPIKLITTDLIVTV